MSLDMAAAAQTLYGFAGRETDQRRKPREERKTYDIKQMWQRTHEVVNLAATGLKGTKIAEIVDCTPQTVSNILNSTLGENKLSDIRLARDEKAKELQGRIAELTEKALTTYEEILKNETASLSLKKQTADTIILDLAGHRAPTKIQSQSFSTSATLEEIEEFKRRGFEAARQSGMIVEAEGEGGRV